MKNSILYYLTITILPITNKKFICNKYTQQRKRNKYYTIVNQIGMTFNFGLSSTNYEQFE